LDLGRAPAQVEGCGKATGLRCPSRSTARTPKNTLSLDTSSVVVVTSPTGTTVVQVGLVVSRYTTSYPARSASVPRAHRSVVWLVSWEVSISTLRGVPGACASDHSTAPFTRATRVM